MKRILFRQVVLAGFIVSGLAVSGTAQQGSLESHIAGLKRSVEQNRQQLKQYQWTETTVVVYKGEERSRKQYTCRYGPDGTVQKVLVFASPEKQEHGLRGHIEERKKDDLTEYAFRAQDLVKQYLPPDPMKIKTAVATGKASMTLIDPGKRLRLTVQNYQLPGDSLAIDMDPSTYQLLAAKVETYLNHPSEIIGSNVQFASLPSGTDYPATIDLTIPDKDLAVHITNSNYQKIVS